MKRFIVFLAFVGFFIVSVSFAYADGPFSCLSEVKMTPKEVIARIERAYEAVSSFEAVFIQHSYLLGLDRTDLSRGRLFFQRPGKMFWDYEQPEKQRFVADGTIAWFYQPSANQVTVSDYSAAFNSELPVSFLLGLGSLAELFEVKKLCSTENGIKVELLPTKADGNLEYLHLLVNPDDFRPIGARVENVGGNQTSIVLSERVYNQPVSDTKFAFNVPSGVDVIDRRGVVEGSPNISGKYGVSEK